MTLNTNLKEETKPQFFVLFLNDPQGVLRGLTWLPFFLGRVLK